MDVLRCLLFLGAVLAVRGVDPTTVCYPPLLRTQYLNMLNEDYGYIYIDFAKERFVEISSVTNNRYIHDFATLKSYAISGVGTNITCKDFKLHQSQIMYRCLPPYAKPVYPGTGWTQMVGSAYLYLYTWDIQSESDIIYRVVFSQVSGKAYFPFMTQEYGYHGTRNMNMYLNPIENLGSSDMAVFTIPAQCNTNSTNISHAAIVG